MTPAVIGPTCRPTRIASPPAAGAGDVAPEKARSDGDVLDLCSSFTSHYPEGWKARRCVALGLNYLELGLNPSKTEYRVQDLNADATLPYADGTFDELMEKYFDYDLSVRPSEQDCAE